MHPTFARRVSDILFLLLLIMVHVSPATSLSPSPTMISINELLSTCIDACLRGCDEIRAVQKKRQATGRLQRTSLKEIGDPKSALTEADGAAQTAIVSALIKEWGTGLEIIGEEDDDESEHASETADSKNAPTLRRDLCRDIFVSDIDTVSLSDIQIWVDPLDGTREYVEERLSNCQSLIGITIQHTPVAGVMGVPFPDGTLSLEPSIVYGHVGAGHGVYGTPVMKSNTNYENLPRPFVASGDSQAQVMIAGREIALEGTNGSSVLYGGAGNKVLATAFGHVDCCIIHKFGGPWDACAPEAVLKAMGGRITTWTGEDLSVTHRDAPSYVCSLGFIATGPESAIDHDELIAALRESQVVQEHFENVKSS